MATYKKNLLLHDISKHNNNKKQRNLMFGERFCQFFISALHFWIEHYTNFLILTKFVSQHLIATCGHFHRHGGHDGNLATLTILYSEYSERSICEKHIHTRRYQLIFLINQQQA
jgi:hypothetical protein